MSALSSFFPARRPQQAMISQERSDPLSDLRFSLEIMPGSRKYVFTPAARAEVLTKLYASFMGPYLQLFLPNSTAQVPQSNLLSEYQASVGFSGAGREEPVVLGRPCSHIFKKGESCYRCKDCALDDSCVICAKCFHATNHTTHNVSFFIAQQSGGCCDCGDEEAWRIPIVCPYHPPLTTTPKPFVIPPGPLPNEVPPVQNYPHRIQVPTDLRDFMRRTVGFALDFLLDTLDYSPDEPSVPPNEADLRLQPSADPMMKDVYCVVLWNDDKHTFDEVTKLIMEMTSRSKEDGTTVMRQLDESGRTIIDMNTNVGRLLEMSHAMTQIDLGVTIRRAYDTFCEQVAAVIIEWLLDLSRSRLGPDTLILREIIVQELLSPRRRDSVSKNAIPSSAVSLTEIPNATRIDYLFVYHTRLWKKTRLSLKEIYASLISLSRPHKLTIAGHFSNVYHRIVDTYLLIDREAETSIKYFALQLFTVPSVSGHIVKNHKIITKLLSILGSFFTNQIADKHVVLPSPFNNTQMDVESFPFKSKRFMPIFSDLRYLCHTEHVQTLICSNREYVAQFARTCQLFMCVNPNKRAVSTHVEYETDAWISVFNVTLSLSRVIKAYGQAFARATVAELVAAITTVVHHILMVCTLSEDRLDRTKFSPIVFHQVVFGDVEYQVVQFDVLEGWVSFHHSLHWLLADFFKHTHLLAEARLREIGLKNIRDIFTRNASEQAILTVIDFPLRVISMVAQIRTGLWVRNGFAIRGQLMHYRDYMLRELCFDQDLFIVQTALVILDPNTVIVSVLDRFGLLGYFSGAFLHSTYEGHQLSGMVEEVLFVFITILSENAAAGQMSTHDAVRREIVHALAMGSCGFSELVKRVAERFGDNVDFDRILADVATFKAPEMATDVGIYELKDDAYDEVNPFFFHYTRNRREEVENTLKNRLRKQTGEPDPVIVPKPFGIMEGPFSIIPSIFESEVLLQIMFYTVYNVLVLTESSGNTPPSAEAILDQVLHLTMLAIVERVAIFSHLAVIKAFEEEKTLIDVICALEHHEKYKAYKSRVQWILGEMEIHIPEEVRSRRRVFDSTKSATNSDELKKKAAKARQEAIMQQMKAQQASFAINFDDADDGDEDSMEESEEEQTTFGTCIVCQEDLNSNKVFGALGLIQPSRFIRRHPDSHNAYLNDVLQSPPNMDRSITAPAMHVFPPPNADELDAKANASPNFEGFPASYTRFGLVGSVCTHMMHLECFQVYSVSIRQRHRAQATRNHPESIPRKEYICPLCKSLGNVIIPVSDPATTALNSTPFPDWIRAAGINILKSKPDALLDSLQFRNGTGEFVFWSAQDSSYSSAVRNNDRAESMESAKMLDTVMVASKSFSQQTRHLRDRSEPEAGDRGAGIYLPEELVGYTVSAMEIAQRGTDAKNGFLVDNVSEPQMRMIRGLVSILTRLVGLQFKGRPDEGKEAVRQAIIKRLLPEWSRTSLTSFSYPLLLRDPFTILVETAAVAPEMLRHVLVLTYYACLARAVIGLVYILNKTRSYSIVQLNRRAHEDVFGDVRMFFMSVVRHSPVFEHTSTLAFETFGEARIEKLLYTFTLPFLRRAAILCRSILPGSFPTSSFGSNPPCEYNRLLGMLGIPPLADLPNQDTLQNALSGWCAHYGHSHAASQLNCGVMLDYPGAYRLSRLPLVLDSLFSQVDKALTCARCNTIPIDAAICLICGTAVCFQSSCCVDLDYNNRGECNMHTRDCGGMVGLYYLVKRCSILYLNAGNGTFYPSPYLDVHGEADLSMRRGRRQYLHHARWEEVRKVWLNHGIPTIVARKLESTLDPGGWEAL